MKDLISSIFNIIKYLGKAITIFRNTFINILFLSILVFFIISIFSKEEFTIENNSSLLLTISGRIVEEKQEITPLNKVLNESFSLSNLPEETLLQDILDTITSASDDPRINSIVLDMSKMGRTSINQLYDIGESLLEFKKIGKTVIAAENLYTQNQYFLASYADKIFLNPMGAVDLHGLGTHRLYFNEALEKLKINYHVFRVGTFKSALEPLTRNSMSEEAKAQNSLWLNALWGEFTHNIISRRDLTLDTINLYTNNIAAALTKSGGDTAQLAIDTNLVDELKTQEELRTFLKSLTGNSKNDDFKYVSFKQYLKTINRSYTTKHADKDAVGVIIAQGNILNGEQQPGNIGGKSLSKLIRQARQDNKIKAVVLRINSGGGSVFASEMIRRELLELKNSGKPFVVSMGSMAASGGYWIAAEADEIWAYPTTLTGSIGIFGAVPTFEETLAHIGVHGDGTGTTRLSSGLNLTQPLSQELKDAIQLSINYGYQKFLGIVSNGRKLDPESLSAVVEGRVFDGVTAKNLGLVDNLGNLKNAIEASAKMAGIKNYYTRYIKKAPSFTETILQQLNSSSNSMFANLKLPISIADKLRPFLEPIKTLTLFDDPRGMYAHCMIYYF